MSRPRYLADQDLNDHIITGLLRREPAVEIARVRDIGLADRGDADILEYASQRQMLVVSHDVNTMANAAVERVRQALPMSGLILIQQSMPVSSAVEQLVLIWSASEQAEWNQWIVFLPI
jgi:hypothetical protein